MVSKEPKNVTWNASDYAKNSSAQAGWAAELIGKLHLAGTETVLDVGCGDGKITAALAAQLPQGAVTGIDRSADMIELARKAHRAPNLTFMHMDATDITLPGGFDVAFSNAVLYWVMDHVTVLTGVKKCLNPGGRILFQMGGRGNAADVQAAMEGVMARKAWCAYFDGFSFTYNFCGPDDYETWLAQTGFSPRRIELIPKDMVHESVDGLKGWLRTTWLPFLGRVPEAARERFADEVIAAYLDAFPPDTEGRTHVSMVRLEVEAEAV